MKASKIYFFTSLSHAVRIVTLLIVTKLIAQALGPDGFGQLGHFMTLNSSLFAVAGGGILNGIVNYVSRNKNEPTVVLDFMSSVFTYSIVFSFITVVVYFLAKNYLLTKYFIYPGYEIALLVLVVFQFFYSVTNLFVGYVNGIEDTKSYSKVIIIGHILALPICYFMISRYQFIGAAVALLLPNLITFFPAFWYIVKKHSFSFFKLNFNPRHASFLFKFSAMTLISVIFFPVAEIAVRQQIIQKIGHHEAGLFQGLWRLSLVYISFISTFLVFYFLPQVSNQLTSKNNEDIKHLVKKTLYFIWGVFAVGISIFLLAKNEVIGLVLSNEFLGVADYVKYQVLGDLFKITGYVFIYVIISKANLVKYALSEASQAIAFYAFSSFLIEQNPNLTSVYKAHILSTLVYMFTVIALSGVFSSQKSITHKI